MRWRESWRADPAGRRIADGHYNRQNPESEQFVPPGRCVVLVIPDVALWVASWPYPEYVKHAWPGGRDRARCEVERHETTGGSGRLTLADARWAVLPGRLARDVEALQPLGAQSSLFGAP